MKTKPGRHIPAAGVVLLLLATPAAAAPGAGEPGVLTPAQSSADQTARRDRAVTEDDYRKLAPPSPGPDVHRPQAPSPMAAPENKSKALNPPAIDDRSYKQLGEETRKRVPAHTPEWTDHNEGDPGTTGLDAEGGRLRFGDGEHGRRPPAGEPNLRHEYRPGAGTRHNPPAPPGPVPVPYPNTGHTSSAGPSDEEEN